MERGIVVEKIAKRVIMGLVVMFVRFRMGNIVDTVVLWVGPETFKVNFFFLFFFGFWLIKDNFGQKIWVKLLNLPSESRKNKHEFFIIPIGEPHLLEKWTEKSR